MIVVIYILIGIIVLTLICLSVDTYRDETYLKSREKLTIQQRKDILRTYRLMVDLTRNDYILGYITKEEYEENLKKINEKIDLYEESNGRKTIR